MKTIIIGGGVAGLTAGIYGQLSGLDCLIVEKNKFVGGNLTGWERKGCAVDNCMHWLNGTRSGNDLNNMWRTVGLLSDGTKICKHSAFYSVELNGQSISLWRDPKRTLKEMLTISPYDSKEAKKFVAAVQKAAEMSQRGIIGKIMSLPAIPRMLRYSKITLGELSERFKHPILKCLITDYFSPELSALSLVLAYSAFISGNADVPYGGSKEAAERMEQRYLALGGKLITMNEVKEILIKDKRAVGVRLSDGRSVLGESVIACCDPSFTFGQLLSKKYMPKSLKRAYKDKKHTPLFSAVHAAFSCDNTEELPQNPTILEIEALNIDGRRVGRMLVKPYKPSEIRIPNGKAVLQVMICLYEDEASKWIKLYENKDKYRKLKNKLAESVGKRIANRFPSVKKSLKLLDTWTPASYNRYFHANNGAFLSFAMKPGKAMSLRVPSKVKGVKNLYIASQWQRTPGGLPIAAAKGQAVIKDILRRKYSSKKSFFAFNKQPKKLLEYS